MLAIREINTGTYVFAAEPLVDALDQLDNDNSAGEYYLGDVLPMLREQGLRVVAHLATDPNVNLGVNHRADLALVTAEARRQILERHMLAGVTIVDPDSTWIDADVEIAADATIEPGTTLRGATTIGADSIIGPHSTLIDTEIGAGVRDPALLPGRGRGRRRRDRRPVHLPAPRGRARRRRQGRQLRRDQELARSARAPRCRTSPTSATPRSAPAPTSAPARSPPTTTAARRTGRRSGKVRESRSTPRSSRRSASATTHTLAPVR